MTNNNLINKCRIDHSNLTEILDFGDLYFSDFVDNATDGFKSPLKLGISESSGLVQLYQSLEPEKMYRKYWYRSGINESMIRDLKNVVDSVKNYVDVKPGDTVLDIAANDGTLLGFWENHGLIRIGIDPARNLEIFRTGKYEQFVEDFFSEANYKSVSKVKAKVITSIAMFYDLPDPKWFVNEVKQCLHENGVWIIQMSYMPLMLEQNAFDNICHEHIQYYTLTVLNNILKSHDLCVIDVELNDVNSGSFRVYITHKNNNDLKLSEHGKIIGKFRVDSLLSYEKTLELNTIKPYLEFAKRVEIQKKDTIKLLTDLKAQGKLVIGYGASTKGNTLLQYYGITSELIPFIAERSPEKWGKVTVGTGIPIISEQEMRIKKPDFLFILPWHFVNNFAIREKNLLDAGVKLIVPLPNLMVRN
jgi:2-polyprenyl-3-methyl-5-hydroxy-6-metoxy-1,4-benzoquinol methylase